MTYEHGMDRDWLVLDIKGERMSFRDIAGTIVRRSVGADLLQDTYGLDQIQFPDDSVVLDIGANIGMVSTYLARKHPRIKILAFEPVKENYENLVANIIYNGVGQIVKAQNLAVTDDGRTLPMIAHLASNTGGATGFLKNMDLPGHQTFEAKSVTLDQIFDEWKIDRCRLLKIDCEGAEYEILYGAKCLNRVDYLSAEFHTNGLLTQEWGAPKLLKAFCSQFIRPENIRVQVSRMAE